MMWSRRALVGTLALAWVAGAAVAEEHSSLYDNLGQGVLDMHIEARVVTSDMADEEQTVLWDASMTRRTMMGRSVTIRMQGSNVLVSVRLTPYLNSDNVLMLICQGETWISKEDDSGVSYRTSLEALAVDHGEPVYFFPLGAGARAEVIAAERSQRNLARPAGSGDRNDSRPDSAESADSDDAPQEADSSTGSDYSQDSRNSQDAPQDAPQDAGGSTQDASSDGASVDPENDYNLVLEILVVPSSDEDDDSRTE